MKKDSASQPSICLVLPFFDEKKKFEFFRHKNLPKYVEYFIATFGKTHNITLKFFTNAPLSTYQKYCDGPQIEFHSMSLKQVFNLFRRKLDLNALSYRDFRAYKLCDFKPTYGLVFSEYLKGFDFWGYCDADMIIGDLSSFFLGSNIQDAELVSATSALVGYMTLYRNTPKMNSLYQRSADHIKVINSSRNCRFDECGNNRVIAMKQVVAEEKINIRYITDFVHNDCGSNNLERPWKYHWRAGKLTDCLSNQPIGALHLVKCKRQPGFIIPPLAENWNDNTEFYVSKAGIQFI